ncbi:hypothetical protein F3K43_12585 [Streptomyces sp. LBUM 1476]|nr:hypothetical protein [Streptomyces sp. LBUM 1476]MBZ3915262.1 hypothetical protein [Streptomyces acidiscabies]
MNQQEPAGPLRVRLVEHPGPYALRGMPVWCTQCRAKRDWVFINQGRNVWVSCRCGHTWHEPEITRADYDAISIPGSTTYLTVEAALEALGFDGSLRGIYFD